MKNYINILYIQIKFHKIKYYFLLESDFREFCMILKFLLLLFKTRTIKFVRWFISLNFTAFLLLLIVSFKDELSESH